MRYKVKVSLVAIFVALAVVGYLPQFLIQKKPKSTIVFVTNGEEGMKLVYNTELSFVAKMFVTVVGNTYIKHVCGISTCDTLLERHEAKRLILVELTKFHLRPQHIQLYMGGYRLYDPLFI